MDESLWLVIKEEVAEALKINETKHDDWFNIVIDGCSEWIETQCDRQFKKRTFIDEVIGEKEEFIILEQRPIISITSFVDEDGNAYTESNDNFRVDKKSGILRLGFALSDKILYTITYVAGFEDIPGDLKMACIRLVGILHQVREQKQWNTKARTTQAGTVTFRIEDIPKDVSGTISKYQDRRIA